YDTAGRHQRGYCQRRQGRSRVARNRTVPAGLCQGRPPGAAMGERPALPTDAETPPAAGCGGHWTGDPAARSGTVTPAVGSAVWRARGGDGDDRTMGGLALQFATCEVGRAISFINKSYKSSAELKPEDVP